MVPSLLTFKKRRRKEKRRKCVFPVQSLCHFKTSLRWCWFELYIRKCCSQSSPRRQADLVFQKLSSVGLCFSLASLQGVWFQLAEAVGGGKCHMSTPVRWGPQVAQKDPEACPESLCWALQFNVFLLQNILKEKLFSLAFWLQGQLWSCDRPKFQYRLCP